jgi:hypothetical protein
MKPIRLIPDQAIAEAGSTREDALGFSSYADVISRIVVGTRGPFTIGVFGEWGMGKTSLMKMVEQRVPTVSAPDHVIVPVWFNAWMFERAEYPIVPLIKSVVEALRTKRDILQSSGLAAENLVNALESLVTAFKLKGSLGLPGGLASLEVEASSANLIDAFRQRRNIRRYGIARNDPYEDIFEALHAISNSAVPRDVTIMVLIDDLDRCFPENAVRLLEGIKLVLSQPGFIFILGASRVVIEEYLQSKYQNQYGIAHYDGKAYLDKMIQLSFDIPPHANRVNDFTKRIIADLGDKQTERDLAPISTIIGGVCQYNPRTIIRFINRLITDSAIYRQNNNAASARLPVGVFAVTRSLQHSWRDFYGLLIGDDRAEDREYCTIVAEWTGEDLTSWKKYDPETTVRDPRVAKTLGLLKEAEPEALKQIAAYLENDRALRSLMDGKIGREWLKNHTERETSISFLTTHSTIEDPFLAETAGVSPGAWENLTSTVNTQSAEDIYKDALGVIIEGGKASTSLLQRRLRIGYGRAARIIEEMEQKGIVGPADGARPREVLVASIGEALAKSTLPKPETPQVSPPAPPKPAPKPANTDINDYYFYPPIGQ